MLKDSAKVSGASSAVVTSRQTSPSASTSPSAALPGPKAWTVHLSPAMGDGLPGESVAGSYSPE